MQHTVITSYLEMHDPSELRAPALPDPRLRLERVEVPSPELNRFLYTAVGGDWYWLERRTWSYQQWLDLLNNPAYETWIGYMAGNPIGYCEVERQEHGDVELVYFGLLPQFIGRGLGSALLSAVVQQAWQPGTRRVWLHTCTLDGPTALQNYQSRGFKLYNRETKEEHLPERSPGPWDGSDHHELVAPPPAD